jgi:hypothetical protein
MNIFYTNRDPVQCAKDHCDKHCVKMILEYGQLLSTAHRLLGNDNPVLYKATHKNHPSAVWARANVKHYDWLYRLLEALSQEYTSRYGRVHRTWFKLSSALREAPSGIPNGDYKDPPQCMPDQYKGEDAVKAYQNYVRLDKEFAEWNHSPMPEWMIRK